MKALMLMILLGFATVAMAQEKTKADKKDITFDSPEATIIRTESKESASNQGDHVVFTGPDVQVKETKVVADKAKPRIEFTSPAPTTISTSEDKKD